MSPRMGKCLSDAECIARFKSGEEWGLLTSIDLHDCDPVRIASKEVNNPVSVDLCNYIDMKRFGEPIVVRFGADPRVQGYSLAQLIETSLDLGSLCRGHRPSVHRCVLLQGVPTQRGPRSSASSTSVPRTWSTRWRSGP